MDDLLLFFSDEAIAKSKNEIKFYNFLIQGKSHQILSLDPRCPDNINNAYLALYDYLVKKMSLNQK